MELQSYIDAEALPCMIGMQKDYVYIYATHHPFEEKFLGKLDIIGFKIISITNLKEIGQTITCSEALR